MSNQTLKEQGWEGFSERMWERARRSCVPITGTFELTPLCNFSCRMCYVRLDKSELPLHGRLHTADEWLSLARQAMEMGTYHITLTGGEALTRPDFEDIYTGLIEMGILTSVLSNASLITEETVRLFQTYQPRKLRFTLYGGSNATYERLCGAPNGFDRVMRSLHLLKEGRVPFSLSFTATKENVNDLDAVLDIAKVLGVGVGVTANIHSPVRGATSEAEELRLDNAEIPSIGRPIDNDRPDPRSAAASAPDQRTDLFARCKEYRTSFFVCWNGLMETCAYMSSNATRPFEEGFETAWRRLHENLSRLQVPTQCASCEAAHICPVCPGLRESETGSPIGIPEHVCNNVRARYTARMQGASKGGETQ